MQPDANSTIDIDVLKAQVDAELSARLLKEADAARHIQRRGFRAAELKLLVELDATSEVSEVPPLFRLPGAPPGVIGLVNSHGRVMPVVDLSALLDIQKPRSAETWMLTCGRGDGAVGVIIDSLPERKRFVQNDEVSLSEVASPLAAYARAAYREGNDVWLDVDFEALFTATLLADK